MTVLIDDAGSGDLLFGIVIGAYRREDQDFKYDVIDVSYFQSPRFGRKEYLGQASKTVFSLLDRLKLRACEPILICRSYIFDAAVENLRKIYGTHKVRRVKVVGEPQRLTETAYLDEIRNLGYEPLKKRDEKRAKSFFHMMRWVKANPKRLNFAKTGWPRLKRYKLFKNIQKTKVCSEAVCSKCGKSCEVPFKPDGKRAVLCYDCLRKKRKKPRKSRKI